MRRMRNTLVLLLEGRGRKSTSDGRQDAATGTEVCGEGRKEGRNVERSWIGGRR
jgi:hypothetical protein